MLDEKTWIQTQDLLALKQQCKPQSHHAVWSKFKYLQSAHSGIFLIVFGMMMAVNKISVVNTMAQSNMEIMNIHSKFQCSLISSCLNKQSRLLMVETLMAKFSMRTVEYSVSFLSLFLRRKLEKNKMNHVNSNYPI